MRICDVESCDIIHFSKGYCRKHYLKFKKYGDPLEGKWHGKLWSPEYITWVGMKQRCNYVAGKQYKDYGGRGIKVCDRWNENFNHFLEDMGERTFEKAVIDRIDNDGNYEPGNCRWVSQEVNNQNRRSTKLTEKDVLEIRGIYPQKTLKELAKDFNVSFSTISYVVNKKSWSQVQ